MHGRLLDGSNAKVFTTLPKGQCYVNIVKQHIIFETIVNKDIVLVLSSVDDLYMHSVAMYIVGY